MGTPKPHRRSDSRVPSIDVSVLVRGLGRGLTSPSVAGCVIALAACRELPPAQVLGVSTPPYRVARTGSAMANREASVAPYQRR